MSTRLSSKKKSNKRKASYDHQYESSKPRDDPNQWYFVNEDRQGEGHNGPYNAQALRNLYVRGTINKETFVWNGKSVKKWTTIREVLKGGALRLPKKSSSISHNRSLSMNCVTLSDGNPLERPSFEKRMSIASATSSSSAKRRHRRRHFELHSTLYVMDQGGNLEKAEIIDLKDNQMKIHYMGYPSQYDEWIPSDSERIAKKRIVKRSLTKQSLLPEPFKSNRHDSDDISGGNVDGHQRHLTVPNEMSSSVNQFGHGRQLSSEFEDKSPHEILEDWLDENFLFSSYFSGVDEKILWKTENALRELLKTLQDDKDHMISEADDLERNVLRLREKYTELKHTSTRTIESLQHDLDLQADKTKMEVERARSEFDRKLLDAKSTFDTTIQREKQKLAEQFDMLLQKELNKTKTLHEQFEKQRSSTDQARTKSLQAFEEKLKTLESSLQVKHHELVRSDTSRSQLEEKVSNLEGMVEKLRQEKEQVEVQKTNLWRELTSKFESMAMSDKERTTSLLEQLTHTQVQCTQLSQEIGEVRAELNEKTRTIETAEHQIESLTESKAKVEMDLIKANAVAQHMVRLEQELQAKKREVSDSELDIRKLKDKLETSEKQWREKLDGTERAFENVWKQKLQRSRTESLANEKDLKHQLELEKLNTAKVQAKMEQIELQCDSSELQRDNERLKKENSELEKHIARLQGLESHFQSEQDRFSRRESHWKRDRDEFVKKMTKLGTEVELLNEKKESLEQHNASLAEELDFLSDQMNPLMNSPKLKSARKSSVGVENRRLESLMSKIQQTNAERDVLEKGLDQLPYDT